MGIALALAVFAVSLAALIGSVHFFLRSVRHIGISLNVRPFVVGALIIAFGTTTPELMISLFAVLNGSLGVPIAQSVGSNIANILLVLGVASLFVRRASATMTKNVPAVDLPFIVGSTFLFILVVSDGAVHLYEGVILLLAFALYAGRVVFSKKKVSYPVTLRGHIGNVSRLPCAIGVFLAMTVSIAVSSHIVVTSLQNIAQAFAVPEGVIAVTALAIGTSLPELIVSVQAALRNEIELVYGSIVGANIFNLLVVTGVPSLISTLYVDVMGFSLMLLALAAALSLFVLSAVSSRIRAWEGIIFVLLYVTLITQLSRIMA